MAGDIVKQLRDTRYPGQMEMRLAAAEEIETLRFRLWYMQRKWGAIDWDKKPESSGDRK